MLSNSQLSGGIRTFEWTTLPTGWRFELLGEICSIRRGASPRPAGDPFYFGGQIPWFKIGDATKEPGRWLRNTEDTVNEAGAACSVRVPAGSLIVANSGVSLGFAVLAAVEGCIHDGWLLLYDFVDADRDYLYYCINYFTPRIRNMADGTTQPNLNTGIAARLIIPLPPLLEQRAIADILAALDDKIELSRRTSETLEAIARAIFKSWFVDFDPVRAKAEGRQPAGMDAETAALFPGTFSHSDTGPIPKCWKVRPLADLASYLNRGIAPAYLAEGGVRVINQKCIRDHRIIFDQARRHNPEARAIAGRELEAGDILVNSTGEGTLGRVAQVFVLPEAAIVDAHVTVVRPKKTDANVNFLGLEMLGRETEIEALAEGSTGQTELSRSRLGALQVMVPPPEIQKRFDALVGPLRASMALNDDQAATLAKVRDALLPKLLSGELRIRDAEKMVEAHV